MRPTKMTSSTTTTTRSWSVQTFRPKPISGSAEIRANMDDEFSLSSTPRFKIIFLDLVFSFHFDYFSLWRKHYQRMSENKEKCYWGNFSIFHCKYYHITHHTISKYNYFSLHIFSKFTSNRRWRWLLSKIILRQRKNVKTLKFIICLFCGKNIL